MKDVYLTMLDAEYLIDAIQETVDTNADGIHLRFGDSSKEERCSVIELTPIVRTVTLGGK